MITTRVTRRRSAFAAIGLSAALLVTGCNAGQNDSADSSSGSGGADSAIGYEGRDSAVAAGSEQLSPDSAPQPAPVEGTADTAAPAVVAVNVQERSVIQRASITVRVPDIAAALAKAENLTAAAQGIVAAESTGAAEPLPVEPGLPGSDGQTAPPPSAPGTATMTLRVPGDSFRPVLRDLAGLGTRLAQSTSAQDVTGQVVDIESRVKTMTASVERVRTLLAQAKTIGEVVAVESELTRREADLESLQAQRKALTDQTSLTTIQLSLVTPDTAPEPQQNDNAFIAGLKAGGDAAVAVFTAIVVALGAILPFLPLLLVVWLIVLWLRRRRRPASTDRLDAEPTTAP